MLLMVQAMNTQVGNPARKLVLLKLADHANDEGICWPSYESIAKQCEISKRTVIRHIAELEKQGLVQVFQRERNGHHHNQSNKYVLRLNNSQSLSPNPETKKPKNDGDNLASDGDKNDNLIVTKTAAHSDKNDNVMVTQCHPNQSYRTSHKIEPNNISCPRLKFVQPPSQNIWQDYLEHRKNKKAKLTETALNRLVQKINAANKLGYATDDILAECMLRNWQGFEVSWLEQKKYQRNSLINEITTRPSNPEGFVVING
ncbi:helix-turn-helix domain-containing protein [Arsenophonus apicola]|uniref:helix-turn-helix domain-containing protein n=1 Tax=Arsenophonus apicola TaxID=2879119 RepID=UPI0038793B54